MELFIHLCMMEKSALMVEIRSLEFRTLRIHDVVLRCIHDIKKIVYFIKYIEAYENGCGVEIRFTSRYLPIGVFSAIDVM